MHGQAQPHDMGIELPELKGGGVFWQRTNIDPEEIDRELTVDVMKLIVVLPIGAIQILPVYFLQIMEIVRALRIHAFVNDEELAALLWYEGVPAERATEYHFPFLMSGIREKSILADFAEELPLRTVVLVEIDHGSATAGASDIIRDITGLEAFDRFQIFAVSETVIEKEIFPVPILWRGTGKTDNRKFIDPVLLVFRGMRVIKSPLFKRDVFADERNKPAILLIEMLNDLK